jgi:F-type H+-transporting ATPase subunit epsilon
VANGVLKCVVVTPEMALRDVGADFVALPLYDGEVGILAGRAPFVGRLGYGEMRIKRGNETERLYVDGGFAQVRDDVVTVLTARAVPADKINPATAREALEKAEEALRKAVGPEAQEAQRTAQQKARAQLRVAAHAGHA